MSTIWPLEVERVASFLRGSGAEARLEEFAVGTATAREAADAIGCEPRQVVKSLVFVCDEQPLVALLPGDRRADSAKIGKAVGAVDVRIASPDEVVAATGFLHGAVAPFPAAVRAVIEQTLLAEPIVWAGAGSPQHLVSLTPAELLRLSRAVPMDVVEEPAYDSSPEKRPGNRREPS
jgi:prolyl-tRNA editing enzyme YbaK/EbsC (Cys-tRNA(Pro) deacylase)